MKQVKCIKDTIGFKKGELLSISDYGKVYGDGLFIEYEKYPEYFQKVSEEPVKKPKYKVGDNVVRLFDDGDRVYGKVNEVRYDNIEKIWLYNNLEESVFQYPTAKELSLYFN